MNDWIHFFGKIKFVSNTTEIREHNSAHHSCQAGLKIEEIIIQALFWWFYYWTGFNLKSVLNILFLLLIKWQMAWWWALEPRNPRSDLAAHSEADLMQGRAPPHLCQTPGWVDPSLPLHLSGFFSWLIFLQSFRFIQRHNCILYLMGMVVRLCSVHLCRSVACSWHIMTFSLEFSWITWIPLPGPEPAVTVASWPPARNEAFCHSQPQPSG